MTKKEKPAPGASRGTGNKQSLSPRNNTPAKRKIQALRHGSDVEIARALHAEIESAMDEIVHADGAFWYFCGTHWTPIEEHSIRKTVQDFDGRRFGKNQASVVRLSKSHIDSILHELTTLAAQPAFFENPAIGINCADGFIVFDAKGRPSVKPHDRKHRQRHVLPGKWTQGASFKPPADSLLGKLLDGAFRGDEDAAQKIDLISELAGCAALGHATRLREPKAVILHGQTAENGKSQILDMLRALLPPSAISAINPAAMADDRHRVGLIGKLLNATDELSGAAAIGADTFKSIITGEPLAARDVFKSRVEFRPVALHVFATNVLPDFRGGIDRGVRRRLLVIPFNRTIPPDERIDRIGRKIGQDEPDALLAFAVAGAGRLIRNRGFVLPPSADAALHEWIEQDPVAAWLREAVEYRAVEAGQPAVRTRDAFAAFRAWAEREGYDSGRLPDVNAFTRRVQVLLPAGARYGRTAGGRFFFGIVVRDTGNRLLNVAGMTR